MTGVPAEAATGAESVEGEILRRIDDLANVCVRRFNDDRAHRTAVEALSEQLRQAQSGLFREFLHPFAVNLAVVIDRLDAYAGSDPDFAASVRNELLDGLRQYGVTVVETDGPVDPARHEVVEVVADPAVPPGTIVRTLRRGYAYGAWVFRSARVVVSAS
jgi:molecular chaperone GrpE (heat shock protein)